jgi:hypothetical protein
MINNSTNTPVYGGYHPNDLGVGWFGNFRVDSEKTINFFNTVASKTAPLVHSVNRGELIFRLSDGGFSMQAIRVKIGLTMVLKAWRHDNERAHAGIQRIDVIMPDELTVEQDTDNWLEMSWDYLRALIDQSGPREVVLPDFDDLIPDLTVTVGSAPDFFNEYGGT